MSGLEALTLRDAPLPVVRVSATVVLSILNCFARRSVKDTRVIGALLGEVTVVEGDSKDSAVTVTVTDCFPVPFNERVEEHYVAINQVIQGIYSLHLIDRST